MIVLELAKDSSKHGLRWQTIGLRLAAARRSDSYSNGFCPIVGTRGGTCFALLLAVAALPLHGRRARGRSGRGKGSSSIVVVELNERLGHLLLLITLLLPLPMGGRATKLFRRLPDLPLGLV
jgi:hypothetical protein